MKLDTIFTNGQLYNSKNTAIGVKNGLIKFMGSDAEAKNINADEIINLNGHSVYPGFIDTHIHMLSYCWKKFYEVDLTGCKSLDELSNRIIDFVQVNELKEDDWIVGSGWNHELFEDKRLPSLTVLDKISNTNPIYLNRACYHICVVNSKALELAGVTKSTISPEGGGLDLDRNGELTGILRENAGLLVSKILPTLKEKALIKELIIKGCNDLAAVGITTVHTDDFAFVEDKETLLQAFMELDRDKQLPIRVVLQLRASKISHIEEYNRLGLKSWKVFDKLTIGPIKIIADGSLGSRTAALEEDYSDEPNNKGMMTISEEELEEIIKKSLDYKFDMTIHAIGDRTMNVILNLYEKYIDEYKAYGFIPSIIHCQIASQKILEKFKELDIIANIQPIFLNTDWSMAEERVGSIRIEYSYCWKKFLDYGITCVGSSDAPIESFNPLLGIYSVVTRRDLKEQPKESWMIEECLDISQGIDLYSKKASLACKNSNVGSLEVGKYCDFVVLSEDLVEIDSLNIKDVKVLKTLVNGDECRVLK